MKNSKKLFLIFLSVLIVAFVSCKKDSGGSITAPETFKLSSLVGTWNRDEAGKNDKFTISENGELSGSIDSQNISSSVMDGWDSTKEVTKFTVARNNGSSSASIDFTFTFENANNCKVIMKVVSSGTETPLTFTKQPTTK